MARVKPGNRTCAEEFVGDNIRTDSLSPRGKQRQVTDSDEASSEKQRSGTHRHYSGKGQVREVAKWGAVKPRWKKSTCRNICGLDGRGVESRTKLTDADREPAETDYSRTTPSRNGLGNLCCYQLPLGPKGTNRGWGWGAELEMTKSREKKGAGVTIR